MSGIEGMISLFQSLNVFPASLCIIIAFAIINRNALDFPICERVKRNRIRNRGYAITEMEEMDEMQFRRMFRMSRAAFNVLLSKISIVIPEKDLYSNRQAINSSGSAINNKTKLAVALRYYFIKI
jgi:hypothetical protein